MIKINRRQSSFLIFTFLMIALSFPAVYYIIEKADLPLTVYSSDESVYVKQIKSAVKDLKVNDKIISIDGVKLSSREDIEVIMDTKDLESPVELQVQSGSTIKNVLIPSVPFYSPFFIIIQATTCLIFILLGSFVLIKVPDNKAAELFHLEMLGAAIVMLMTWGKVTETFDLRYITRILFHAAYIFSPIMFIHFSLIFPIDISKRFKFLLTALYIAGTAILIPNVINFLKYAADLTSDSLTSYIHTYNYSRYFMAGAVFTSIIIFLVRYINSDEHVERQKLKWLITGFVVGPLSFALLWVLPQALTDYALVPEEFVYFLMLSVPLTFTISIVKYHLLDIDFIINRSIVYSSVIALVIMIYFIIVMSVTALVEDINRTALSSLSAVFVAFLFNPLKNYVHNFVDKKFFRVQYNFRNAVKAVSSEIKQVNDIYSLSEKLIAGISNLIPVEKIALIDITDIDTPRVLSRLSFPDTDIQFLKENIFTNFSLQYSIVLPDKVEPGFDLFETENRLKEKKINLIIIPGNLQGKDRFVLVIGNKKSGRRYSAEDIDLIMSIFNSAASIMERLRIHEEFVRKSIETEKLQELNKQKSIFVSSVSHDLKTPLTSIRMYSELIKMNSSSDKIETYAEYIEGESERLTRLINNVLNFSRIEKGIKEYIKEPADLNVLVKKSLTLMNYQIKVLGFEVRSNISPNEMLIYADGDALLEIFLNLLNNALKFSGNSKIITISTGEEDNNFSFIIQDYGIGISEENQKKLFMPFYRADQAQHMKIAGAGLGLSIVKNIADAHNIKIELTSKLNQGSTFKLLIPKYIRESAYEEHSYHRG